MQTPTAQELLSKPGEAQPSGKRFSKSKPKMHPKLWKFRAESFSSHIKSRLDACEIISQSARKNGVSFL
ncbi:hypothetical protein JTE90_018849 [Oedothorax gibbosus]|uniref:Ribosomal protein L32 n=1 Tax=Oedothorax gibbosus TaxID=931172 RepID=A0AAV6UWS2_9ARAC|nr:hypothetical protein JTE90_018849 [Oedothorax gibbosus]